MRDFNANQINGDVNINDNSTEHKLLIHCSNEELLHEEIHRRDVLSKERSRKNNVLFKLLGFCASAFVLAAIWYWIKGQVDLISGMLGFASIALTLLFLQEGEKTTEFERRQIQALNEINMLLRERGVR
ncbi:conserved hypothetical protein [Vibrio chagasii]|nr:conserved hypothetical protein [Vibrio chagasii]CAK2192846.1 conserved hypothetical protein [Vibrio crassostreae]